nr:MAG TPA: hypothetical protein [Caudoviricetes sp.]
MEAKDIRKAHCLFEQSGTFKNEFIRLGGNTGGRLRYSEPLQRDRPRDRPVRGN